MDRASILLLLTAAVLSTTGCGKIEGAKFPQLASPRVIAATPSSPASADITVAFQVIDREKEPADVAVEYSTDGATTFVSAALAVPGDALGLASAWHPGLTHQVVWDSVGDSVGISGDVEVALRITPSDASNPSGTPGRTGAFVVNNTAYNQPPAVTLTTPSTVQSGNIQISYHLHDTESNICSIAVEYSPNNGTNWFPATRGPAGEGVVNLGASPSGTPHAFLWDSRADNVAETGENSAVRVRITPTDFHAGAAGMTDPFSVDNTIANQIPTVSITAGPLDSSTVYTSRVTFEWSGNDPDGSVIGYYYSFDTGLPETWTTATSVLSEVLSVGGHTFRVVSVDDQYDLSAVASRTFTVSPGVITAEFVGSPTSGNAPLSVNFTDQSSATNGITSWSWTFGNGDASTEQHPSCIYNDVGTFTVSLTVTGPDGTDTETKTNYITVSDIPTGQTIHVHGTDGLDTNDGLSWGEAVKTIQTGLNKAASDWTVLVADGTYTGALNKNLDFAGKAIHLKSVSGATSCIIDCEDDGRGIYFQDSETTSTTVEGFTIRRGDIGSYSGGGIYCKGSSPSIVNCTITENQSFLGGGIACFDQASPTISNCTVTGNSASNGAGIDCSNQSSPLISDCAVSDNAASNFGGGISCGIYSYTTIINCTINNNTADSGSGLHFGNNSSPIVANCIISNNVAINNGGGIRCYYTCTPTIVNCTVTNNSVSDVGGGIYCMAPSHPTLDNCIIWGNSATSDGHQIYTFDAGTTVTLNSCDYANGGGDVGGFGTVTEQGICLHLDPLFVNASADDYHLQSGSPCVDAGDNSRVPVEATTDLDGKARIVDGDGNASDIVDIGAYEFQSLPQYGWTHRIGGTDFDAARTICVDGSGNLYTAGGFDDTVNFAADWGGNDPETGLAGFLTRVNADGTYGWTRRLPAAGIVDVCVDATGNIYITGSFYEGTTYNFAEDWGGTDEKASIGQSDIFLTKVDTSNNYHWTHRIGGAYSDYAARVCTDGSGNVYLTGNFWSPSVDFAADWGGSDTRTNAGERDGYITKIAANGDYCWTHTIASTDQDQGIAVCTDTGGNVYITGSFCATVNFAADWSGSVVKTPQSISDAYVMKIDSAGDYGWAYRLGAPGWDYGTGICAYGSQYVYVAGTFGGNTGSAYTTDFAADWGGSDEKTCQGHYDAFVTMIESDGAYCWTRIMSGERDDMAAAVCTDEYANIYVVGYFQDVVDFGSDWGESDVKSTSQNYYDAFVTKISPAGGYCWTRRMGGPSYDDMGRDVCWYAGAGLYVEGYFMNSFNFAEDWGGSETKTSAGDQDIFITKILNP